MFFAASSRQGLCEAGQSMHAASTMLCVDRPHWSVRLQSEMATRNMEHSSDSLHASACFPAAAPPHAGCMLAPGQHSMPASGTEQSKMLKAHPLPYVLSLCLGSLASLPALLPLCPQLREPCVLAGARRPLPWRPWHI